MLLLLLLPLPLRSRSQKTDWQGSLLVQLGGVMRPPSCNKVVVALVCAKQCVVVAGAARGQVLLPLSLLRGSIRST